MHPKRPVYALILTLFVIILNAGCSAIQPCSTYSSSGVANEVMRIKAKSLQRRETRFFRKYNRNKNRLVTLARH